MDFTKSTDHPSRREARARVQVPEATRTLLVLVVGRASGRVCKHLFKPHRT